jgi:uncharacterized protein
MVAEFEKNPKTKIIPFNQISFANAFIFYKKRQDKGYSFTDYSSMLIMKEKRIKEILTADQHFMQEGFHAPMLSEENRENYLDPYPGMCAVSPSLAKQQ